MHVAAGHRFPDATGVAFASAWARHRCLQLYLVLVFQWTPKETFSRMSKLLLSMSENKYHFACLPHKSIYLLQRLVFKLYNDPCVGTGDWLLWIMDMLMLDLTHLLSSPDVNWWIIVMFLSDSHSDGTHSLPLLRHISTNLMKEHSYNIWWSEVWGELFL